MEAELHDGTILEFPDGTDPQVVQATVKKIIAQQPTQNLSKPEGHGRFASTMAGIGQGVGTVGLGAQELVGLGLRRISRLSNPPRIIEDLMNPKPRPQGLVDQVGQWLINDAEQGRRNMAGEVQPYEQDHPNYVTGGKIGGEVLATLPVGGILGKGASVIAPKALAQAIRTGGIGGGAIKGIGDLATRMTGGAITGGATGALIDPESAVSSAAIGAVLPPGFAIVGGVLKFVGNAAKGIVQAADEAILPGGIRRSSGRILNELAGEKSPEIQQALRNAPADLTAGQAVREVSRPQMSSLQDFAKRQLPDELLAVDRAQEAARMQLMKGVTPDPKVLEKLRNEITAPMRTTELNAANTAGIKGQELYDEGVQKFNSLVSATKDKGQLATNAAQQKVLSENFYPVAGMPRIAAKYSNNAERIPEYASGADDAAKIAAQRRIELNLKQFQLNSIKEHGLDTLRSANILKSIDKTLNVPGTRASDVVQKSLGYFKDKIASLTDKRGIVDARDLYTVRKEIGNNISNFAKESGNWDKKMTSGLQRDIQRSIDDAITRAGGDGWNKYLQTYSKFSNAIERSKTMQEMMDVISKPGGGERITPFLNAMKNSEGEIAKLTPAQRGAVSNVSSQLEGQATDKLLSKTGQEAFNKIVTKGESIPTIPTLWNAVVSVSNSVIRKLGAKGTAEVNKDLAFLTLPENKKVLASVLRQAAPKDRFLLQSAIGKFEKVGKEASAKSIVAISANKNNERNNRLSDLAK